MTVRKTQRGQWMVDVKVKRPDGSTARVRRVAPEQTRAGARRYEHEIREQLLHGAHVAGEPIKLGPAPTLAQWVETFVAEHSQAKRLRPSTIREQRAVFRLYLLPALGSVRVDAIRTPHFHQVRGALAARGLSPKTMNNALSVLSCAVRFYYERHGLDAPRFAACMAKVPKSPPKFWEPAQYDQLVQAAAKLGPIELAVVLLMGDCGLRTGEVVALEWSHIRWQPEPQIVVQRSYTAGDFGPPKGGRPRTVPMTARTVAALRAVPRSLTHPWVITRASKWGTGHTTRGSLAWIVCKVERAIGARVGNSRTDGALHRLRHTYITRLGVCGAPARTIMELAGHTALTTTLRYMHLMPGETSRAVSMLETFDREGSVGASAGASADVREA